MQRTRLGCLTGTALIATLITAFAIAGYAFASGGQMFSPGSLNAIHGKLIGGVTSHADIAGDCKACHVAPWDAQSMADRCVVCHTNVPAQLADVQTPHGRMYAIDPKTQCRDCHHEHRGDSASLTDIPDWKYPHQLSGFSLDGHQFKAKNDPFQCADCHSADVTTFDVNKCKSCHDQKDQAFAIKHAVAYGVACLDCHDGKDSLGKKNFTHANFSFKLTGKHTTVACENCHVNEHSTAEFKDTPQNCAACHASNDPHKGTLGSDCGSCHTPDDWKIVRFDHNRAAFKLIGAHVNVVCEKCHANNVFKGTPLECVACHKKDDRHNGELGTDCASCHKPTKWQDVNFDHSTAAFKLTGKHTTVACASCHKDTTFKDTPTNCAACHADVHSGQMGNDCARCHNPSNWKDVHFDHSQTGFNLTGNHKSVSCAACHINGVYKGTPSNCFACHAAKDAHGGQFGTDCGTCHNPSSWKDVNFNHAITGFKLAGSHANVACTSCHVNNIYRGTPTNCYACHAQKDNHNGQFGTDCGSCHRPTKWSDVTFNHSNTGFSLTGKHVNVACTSCHVNNVYKGTPTNCYACHAQKDNHNGQFGTDCGACHNPSGWANVTFNHNKTAFPLIGHHAQLSCTKCHSNGVYKGTPTQCVACHKDQHNGQNGNDCAICHTPKDWGQILKP